MKFKDIFIKTEEKTDSKSTMDNTIFESKQEEVFDVSSTDKNWGIAAHVSFILGFILPLGYILGPFLIWSLKKRDSKFIGENARNALNFQLSFTIYTLIAFIIFLFVIISLVHMAPFLMFGLFLGPFVFIALIQFYLMAKAMEAVSEGRVYKYPYTINFIKDY